MQRAWADFAKDPSRGPGWNAAPEVAMLGGGATPGQSDEGRPLVSVIKPDRIDRMCSFYKVLYNVNT
ncbi:hypothetical protein E4U41_005146 [Claviceps citrina]|nr:hypothetical protein E4U41_005146 [Claviceps citrina]